MKTADYKINQKIETYLQDDRIDPLFLCGDSWEILQELPDRSIDMCITSPPYWRKRQYSTQGIGLEKDHVDYVKKLCKISSELKRVLKDTGSFWLNLGDTYYKKRLLGLPWRIAFELSDRQGWLLRNSVVWNKIKGSPDNSKDKLRNTHENLFHFVKIDKGYYYNVDAIRNKPREAKVVNGAVVSATGVSGIRYRRQIELSTALSESEKNNALATLKDTLLLIKQGKLSDFRMIIRGQQRTTHSNSEKVSGRAKELRNKGFYILRYHPNGSKPGDVWDILPEDTQKRTKHYAPYPIDLCKIPILATCPQNGIVLDPFCGTGTSMLASQTLSRKSIGIDISPDYLEIAKEKCKI